VPSAGHGAVEIAIHVLVRVGFPVATVLGARFGIFIGQRLIEELFVVGANQSLRYSGLYKRVDKGVTPPRERSMF